MFSNKSISMNASSLLGPDKTYPEIDDLAPEEQKQKREKCAFCPKCGTPRKEHQLFCRYCRYAFVEHVEPSE
jgi:hypothetical protein